MEDTKQKKQAEPGWAPGRTKILISREWKIYDITPLFSEHAYFLFKVHNTYLIQQRRK